MTCNGGCEAVDLRQAAAFILFEGRPPPPPTGTTEENKKIKNRQFRDVSNARGNICDLLNQASGFSPVWEAMGADQTPDNPCEEASTFSSASEGK